MRKTVAWIALAVCLPALAGDPLQEMLAAMDASASRFKGVQARIRKASYTAVLDDETAETGTMWMARQGKKATEIRMKIDFSKPDERSVAFAGKKGEIYYPKIKTVQEYDLGKHKSLVESFLLLGFGTSGKQITKDFSVKYLDEAEAGGMAARHLELRPKSKKVRKQFGRIELWVAKDGAYPVQQKFFAPGGDTTTITYTEVEINPKLAPADLVLQLPPGVKREYPMK